MSDERSEGRNGKRYNEMVELKVMEVGREKWKGV